MRKLVLLTIVVLASISLAPMTSFSHEVDPTTLERTRREAFPEAKSWKVFDREIDPALEKELAKKTGIVLRKRKERTLNYHVAFSTSRPGRLKDVLGVFVLREVSTANGVTGVAIGITPTGRIARIVGVDGPDKRAIAKVAKPLTGMTLNDSIVLTGGVTARIIAMEAHAILYATRSLLAAPTPDKPEPAKVEAKEKSEPEAAEEKPAPVPVEAAEEETAPIPAETETAEETDSPPD